MAYDASREKLVLFGGYSDKSACPPNQLCGDTWEWTAASGAWEKRTTAAGPSPRRHHAMTYDVARQRVLLFGGYDGTSRQDTWEWDGTAWTEVTPAGASPTPRQEFGLAYAVSRSRAVLFGGGDSSGADLKRDTWEWDGVARAWTERIVSGAKPQARLGHTFAYDPPHKVVVLFGGSIASGYQSDIWEWNGTTSVWTERTPYSDALTDRSSCTMVYDATTNRMVIVDGRNTATLDEVWEWDGDTLSLANLGSAAPMPSRFSHAMVFDSSRGKVMVFGGSSTTTPLGDLWEH